MKVNEHSEKMELKLKIKKTKLMTKDIAISFRIENEGTVLELEYLLSFRINYQVKELGRQGIHCQIKII